ncbi:threonine aldolase family protein [Bacillus toyonensis]|uniref:threonine aldolase family protein n=1 Tax=Bacillus toyonensis TaxID=155322 RepID=UPI0011A79548|nr:GntG family PLP-dependent aldolase [Bacillus toyonensis]UFI00590.1 beta-eliminating lyase-related protein [Bacillus toyonensis]
MIDLRSDTLTTPSEIMKQAMFEAQMGDDCYGEDESVNMLEAYCKELFQVEGALFIPSGTMSNQLAIRSQVEEGNEIITEVNYHISFYESASTVMLNRVVLNTTKTSDGLLTADIVEKLIHAKPRGYLYAQPQLVSIENTINYYQGRTFPLEIIRELRECTQQYDLALHMDGARLFNAHMATGVPLSTYAQNVDTFTVCFAKGLGAPFGSMLMGTREAICNAKKYRKQFGGGLHQIGMYARAAHYAMENNMVRLREDHRLTKLLAGYLNSHDAINIAEDQVETNILFIDISNLGITSEIFAERCKQKGILVFPWLPNVVRAVVHQHITEVDITLAAGVIKNVFQEALNTDPNPILKELCYA